MSRVQLALNVGNIEEAISFYSKMFGVGPAKVREGYANFAIENPPLKLVLIQGHGEPGTLNHVGVEVEDTDQVAAKMEHAVNVGLPIEVQESTTCCFAVQDKVWVKGGELPWEWYTVLADAPTDTSLKPMPIMMGVPNTGSCCGPEGCS
jgi:lactoylglutathione lyase